MLDAEEVADMLGVTKAWVWDRARRGELPCVQLGRYKKFRLEAVMAWIEDQERAA